MSLDKIVDFEREIEEEIEEQKFHSIENSNEKEGGFLNSAI